MISDYRICKSLDEAMNIIKNENAGIIAGGTDLMIGLKASKVSITVFADISRIEELRKISASGDVITIGSAVTHQEIALSPIIKEKAPLMAKAARHIGSVQIRNVGTIGGNVVNAFNAADVALTLIALNAKAEILYDNDTIIVPVEELYADGGGTKVDRHRQIIKNFFFDGLGRGHGSSFTLLARRKAMTPPILNVAIAISIKDELVEWVRIVMSPVDVKPMRATIAEDFLKDKKFTMENIEQAAMLASGQANPTDCLLGGSRKFRKAALITLVRQGLEDAIDSALKNNQ